MATSAKFMAPPELLRVEERVGAVANGSKYINSPQTASSCSLPGTFGEGDRCCSGDRSCQTQ